MKLRVGLVGLGRGWEVRHRPALRALADRFEVRAVCEQVGVRAEQLQLELEEARQIKERVDKAGVAFMAEFARRQNPATLRLKELIATRLGQPRLLFCHRRIAVGEKPAKPD